MDDQVERLKKLKAGKERLAAFQKKKTKKKKKSDTGAEEPDSSPQRCPSHTPSPECGSPAGAGAACPPVQPSEDADPPSDQQLSEEMTEPSSVHYLNDTGNLTDEINQSLSENEKHSLFNAARMELHQATGKISELEESVLGKQRALERLGLEIQTVKSENDRLKQAAVISNSQMNSYDHLDKCKPGSQRDQVLRIQELENAVVKRDELLRQLSSRLQISVQESADKGLQQVCSAETQKLAQQVQLLQLQLQQAGEKLNGQMKQHCVSAQALQDAKNEILNLQLVIQQKDEMMSQLVQKLSQVNEDYVQLQSSTAIAEQQMIDHQELLKQLNALKDQSDLLSQDLDEERLKNKRLEKQLKDEHLTLMHNTHDEPIAVEDRILTDHSSVNLSQPGKESTLIQELNCEKSKNQALDLQLQNQFHLIQKFVSLYRSDHSVGSTREEFDNVLHQLTELIANLSKNDRAEDWSQHLPNSLKPSAFQDFECQVDLRSNDTAKNNNTSSWSDNDNVHKFSHTQELEELRRKLQDLESENQDLSTEMAKSKSSFNALLATKDELERQHQAAEEYRTSMAETIQGYMEELQALKEENAGLSTSISNLEKSLSAQSEEARRALEAEALLHNELALLKSEKDALNLSFQKKDEDIQILSEKLELSHQEVMNLKNMKRTLEQELSGSQGERNQLKEQLDSRMTETDRLRGDEKALAEKLAASQAEVNRLKIEIKSVIDESSKHQKTVENEMVKLNEVINDYRHQVAELEELNSKHLNKAITLENRLLELHQEIVSLTDNVKTSELNNEKLSEEKNACTQKTLTLVQYFSYLQSLLLSASNPAQQVDATHQLSADDDPEKFGGIINEVSSVFGKHRERIDQLELENNSLMNACIQEKEDIEKTIKEKSNEIIIYQQTIDQTKQTIEALQSENQKLTDQLQEVTANARKNEAEQERLQAQVDSLQMDDAEREHFKQLDQLLVNREQEIERLKTEMDSFTRNFEKENENQRQVISELNEQISKKEEVEQQTSEDSKQQLNQINSLQRLLQDEAEEAQRLRTELSSLRNMKESSSLELQSKDTEIQNLHENLTILNSKLQEQLNEIQTLIKEKDVLVSEIEHLKSMCTSLENNFQKEKSELEKMESEKKKSDSEKMSLREELSEKQKLISNMESHYQSEKEQLNLQNEALSKKLNKMSNKNKSLEDRCAHLGGERDQEVSKMDAELSALKVLLKTHNEESSQKLKETEGKLQDAEKQAREWEQKAQQVKSEQFSAKSNFKNQIQKINKEKEQHKAKIAELSALSQKKEEQEGQLTALLESKSLDLKRANEELEKLKELWQVEKTELCSKMSSSKDGHLEEVKKLKEVHAKVSEEKSKLNNSLKELEKKFNSKELKNEELSKLKELWQVEKTELCSKMEMMSTSQEGHLEELKKLKEAHTKLSEEKSKLSNSLKELEKKFHSKEKSLSDKNSKLQNTIKDLKQKLKDKTLVEENSKLQNSLKDLKQISADSEKALQDEKSKLQDSIKELEQKSLEKEKVLSEENAKLRDSVKELNQKLNEVQKSSGSKRGKNSGKNKPVSEETVSVGSNGTQTEQNDKPLYTKEELARKLEEIEVDLAKKQEDELELMSEKYERNLKYARLDILQELSDEKENYERELDQKYTLKVESLKAETDRSFIKSLQKVRSEMESKHREEMSEQKMSILKECLQMAPHELENRIGNMLHDIQVKNQAGGLLEKYQAKKLAESRDSLLQQIELLNSQYEQLQDEQFPFSERLNKKPVASSPRIRRKFDTLPQDIESASRSLVELSRAKGCYDEEKSCFRLDCQGYRKRYEIALKILTEKGLTSFDNMSEKSSFEVDSLDGSTSVGDQQRDELSQDLQDEYNELMERTMTEPLVSGCFSVKHSPEPQCPSCIILMEEKLSLKKRLSIQLELFGKERFLLQNRCEHLSVELENALLNRDQLQKELTIVKEVQQGRNSSPTEIEFTELKVKLANTEDQVAFLKNKVSQNEIDRQELKTKINDLFVKLIDQQHYIDTLEEEYSRSRSAWHHKGTMTCEDHTSVLPVREMHPSLNRRHSDPNGSGQYILDHISNLYRPRDNRISKSVGNLSPVDDISFEPAMWLPKIPRSRRDTSPDSLNKSPFSDHSSQPEENEYYKNYCPDRTGSSLSDASTLLTADVYVPNTSTPQKLPRATQSSPSLTTLGEFHESDRIFSSDKEHHLPFSTKYLELIDEVAELKRSISKTKEQHIQETAILREFIDRLQQSGSTEKLTHGEMQMMSDIKSFEESVSLSSDVVDLRQKVSLLRETCRKLTEDNGELMKKLYDQECLVMKAKYFGARTNAICDSDELDTLFGKQLLLLQKHRDELSLKLREERSLENQITELVAGKSSLEQILCREREIKEESVYQKGLVDSELASLKAEYERVLQEQLRLEQVIRDKDTSQKEVQAKNFKMDQQLSDISSKLQESEKILREMRKKEAPDDEKNIAKLQGKFSRELHDAKNTIEKQNIQRLEGLRKEMEEQHAVSVDYLRQQLRSDFKLRESRLEEHHASHIASLHKIHGEQLQNLKDEYEAQMEELKQELHKEWIKNVDSGASSNSSTELNGLSQTEQQKQEAQMLVLDKLREVLSAPQRQQLETVMQEIKQQHKTELDRVKTQCEDEIDLRVKAARLTVEQVYKSQSELMKASLEEKKQSELAELRDSFARCHNEEISRRETEWNDHLGKLQAQYEYQVEIGQEPAPKGAVGTLEGASLIQNLTTRLNEEHKKLIEAFVGMGKPSLGLKWLAVSSVTEPWMSSVFDIIVTDQDVHHLREVIAKEESQREMLSGYSSPTQPALHAADSLEFLDTASNASQEGQSSRWAMSMSDDSIHRCLEEQKEEIMLLRSKILKEYEQLLKARTDSMVVGSHGDISRLQDEIEALQQQYEIQIASLKQGMSGDITADSQDTKNLSRCLDTDQRQALNNLVEHFKSKVHSIESRFNNQITGLKFQIESDLSASFGEASCEMDDSFQIDGVPLTSTGRSSTSGQNLLFSKIHKETSSGRHSLGNSSRLDQDSHDRSNNSKLKSDPSEYISMLDKKDTRAFQEEIASLRRQLEDVITSKTFLQREKEELIFAHTQALSGQKEDLEHEQKMEVDDLQRQFDIQLQVELKKQAVELLEKYQAENEEGHLQTRRGSFEKELVKRTMTAGHFDSYDAGDTRNIVDGSNLLTVPCQKFGQNKNADQIVSDYEARIAQMQTDFERRLETLRLELTEANRAEKQELTSKHRIEVKNLQKQLSDVEEKFESVMEGLRTGAAPEVAQMMRDKYDTELELAKALMQQEFDESLEGEQSRLHEQQEKLVEDFLSKKTCEMRDLQRKYDENLESLQKMLLLYEQQCSQDATDSSGRQQHMLSVLRQKLLEKDNKMADEQERHRQEIEKLRGEYEEKIAHLKYTALTQDDHVGQTSESSVAKKKIDRIKTELDTAHQAELNLVKEQLNSKHAKMIENLEKQYQMKIEELETKHKEQLERLQKESGDNGKKSLKKKDVAVQVDLLSPADQTCSPVVSPWSSPSSSAELDRSATPVELMTTRSFADVVKASRKPSSPPATGTASSSPVNSRSNSLSKRKKSGQTVEHSHSLDSDAGRAVPEAGDSAKPTDQTVIVEANQNLLRHLSNLVRSYLNIEDTINKKLHQVLSGSKTVAVGASADAAAGPSPSDSPTQADHLAVPGNNAKRRRKRFKSADRTQTSAEVGGRVNRAKSMDPIDPRYALSQSGTQKNKPRRFRPSISSVDECSSSGDDFHETSITSSVTDEGLVLSQQFSDSIIFTGPTLDTESIELITDTSSRLQNSIMRLLEMMEETTQQLLESKTMQQELLDTLRSKDGDVQNLNLRLQEMSEQLKQEINSREHLALELHKSQGLVEGFSAERDQLSTRLKDLEDREAVLAMENETLRNKIHDLQMSESEVTSLHQEVQRQQTILYDNAGREHQGLLDEICQLNDDKRHMMQLLQQNQDSYEVRIQDLIASGEDIEHKYSEMLEEKRQQIDDLRLQLESVERQLKANKQFLNEQAQEREQEREEFQREINKWKMAMQQVERQQNTETRLKKEVEELSDQLESRINSQSDILMKNEKLERDLQDKELTAQELKKLVSQFEQELDEKNNLEQNLLEKISQLEMRLQTLEEVNNELSDELKTSLPKNEEKITQLEHQLEDQELVYRKKAMSLDEELKKAHKLEEELSSEKTALEQQVCDQLLQIASFKNQLDDYRQRSLARDTAESTDGSNPILDELRAQLQRKDEEILQMTDMVDKLELELVRKDNQLGRLEMANFHREPLSSQSSVDEQDNSKLLLMKDENQKLKSQVSTLQRQVTTAGFSSLAQQLLDEKNEQIDQLKEQLARQDHYNPSDDAFSETNCLKEELEKKTLEIEEKDAEICSLKHMINSLQQGSPNVSGEHFPGDVSLPFNQEPSYLEDSMSERTSLQQELSAVLTDRDNQIDSLKSQLEEKDDFTSKIQMESMLEHQEAIASLQEALQDKDITLDQMYVEVDDLHAEVANLTEHQTKLQEDFDTVQTMLENKEKEIESLTKELSDTRSQNEKSQIDTDVAVRYEVEIGKLKKKVKDLENVIDEKMEENYTLNEKVEEIETFKTQIEKLKSDLQEKEKQLANKISVTQGMEKRIESSNKVIRQLQEREDHWHLKYSQTELQLREREEHLHQLQNELLERDDNEGTVRQRLMVTEQQLSVQQQNIQTLQMQLSERDKRFKEYNETSSELKDTISSLEEEKEQMAVQMSTKDQEIPKLQEQLARLQKIVQEQAADISRREKSYMTLVKMHQEKDEMISMEEGRTVVLRGEVEDLQNELMRKDEELNESLEQLKILKTSSKEQRSEELKEEEEDGNSKIDGDSSALQKLLSKQKEEIKQLQSELETLKELDLEKSERIAQLEAELEEHLYETKTLKSCVDEQKHHLVQANAKAEKLQEELQDTWKSKLAGESQIDELRQKLFKIESEDLKVYPVSSLDDSQTIQSKFTDLWSEIQKRESDVERLECELSDVHQKLRSQEAEILHSHLQTAQDGGQLSEEINLLLGKLQQLELELDAKNKLISCYELQLNKKDDVLQDLQVKLDQTMSTYQHNEQEYHTLLGEEQKQASMAEGRIVVLRSEVDDLQNELVHKENELRSVKDHLMETQGQLIDRAQEMTRLCQRRSSSDIQDDVDANCVSLSVKNDKEQENAASKVSENTVKMLEDELQTMRAQLHARTKQLEEANQNQEVPSVDNTALPHDQLIDHVNQVQDELRITRGVLERLCKANSAQQATLQEREQQVQQLQADLAAMLMQQKAALAAENKNLQKGEVTWPTQSFESPEFHNVGPMAKSPDNRGAQSAAQDVHNSPQPMEQNIQDRLQVLLNRMHREGLQNMSLAELQFIRQYASPKPNPKDIDVQALRAAWEKERQSLLSAIQALKDLLSHEQQITGSQWQSGMSSVDWRSKILQALSHVFAKERDVLLSELHSYVLTSGDGAMELTDIQRLENKIQTQDSQQKAAMEQVVTADRQSLLSELQDCTAKIAIMELQHHEEKHELSEKLTNLERQMSKREEQSQRHIQLLEYRLQQSRIVHDDLQSSLEMERKRAAELAVELTKAKTQSLDMHNECTNLQVNLAKVKDALEQEHSRYLSLMAALEEEKVKTAELSEQLDAEKGKVHDLEVEVENLNGQMGQERDLEFQHLHLALENEKDKLKDAEDVAREKQAENLHLQQELETERLHSQSLIAKNDADVAHMKSCQKENESYIEQLTSNLNKEKALNIQLKQSLDKVCSIRQDTSERDRASITDLQALLDTERSQLKDLQQQMETLRVDSQTKVMALMTEVQGTKEKMEKEKTKFHKLQVKYNIVENQHGDIERQLNYEKERAIRLQAEKHTFALELQNVRQREKERYIAMESEKMTNNKKLKEMARFVDNNKVAMHQNELEAQRLQEKVQALETDLQNSRLRERQLVHEMEYSKLRSPLHLENIAAQARLQQHDENSPKSDSSKREKMLSAYKSQLETVRQHLEFNGIKIQDLLNKSLTYVKSSHNAQSSGAFATLRPLVTTIGELLSDLRQMQVSLTLEKEGPGYPHLSAMVNQRTLQHNRELINSIFTLSEEKLSLREQLLKMEERICDYKNREVVQQTQAVDEQGMSFMETSFSVERMKWEQERTSYELALQNAEKKIEQLQRNLRIERSQGLAASGTNPWVADKELVQSLYQKYLRAESFRKALIYQKNYLLVLLGGFQDSEQTVLALLAQMGATDNNSPLRGGEPRRPGRLNCRRPLTMFRSVARAAIAISRMKFLVRKLQQLCATPLPAALTLGPPALTQQRTGYTASESSSTSSTTSSSSRLTSNKIPSPQDTSPRLTLNPSLPMQGGARARSPPNSNPTSTGRLLPIPGLTPTRNQFLTTHGLKNSRGTHNFNAIPPTEEENGTSLETPNSNSAMMNPKQLRFMTPPTKEISHLRGSLQRVPAIQQLSFDHSNPQVQRTHNDYSPTSTSSSSEGALIASPCPSNGDIPNNENSEEPHVENSTTQDDFLHCIERVQNRVDQLRHPPQIERQRHRRKYDGFHKNVDL